MNLTQQAEAEALLANQVLEECGFDHDGRVEMWNAILSDTEIGKQVFKGVWLPALDEARRRFAQGAEGTLQKPAGPEK